MDRLAPVFRTDFERTAWLLRIPAGERFDLRSPARVEMALDQGEVVAHTEKGRLRDSILELELELQEGEPEVLFRISNLLGKDIRLAASDISKAMRGYRLLGEH
jgi:inorganic triphosphatase YgiF